MGRATLGKGWVPTPMVNNVERLDPYGDDPASEAVRTARSQRVLTALDEGAAWRHRRDGALLVARTELFADDDEAAAAHRAAWQEHGPACLDAVWRARWREREVQPSWIEARWRSSQPDASGETGDQAGEALAPDHAHLVDWLVVEDHTGATRTEVVLRYEHLTVWAGRAVVTLILRHDHRHDLDDVAGRAAASAVRWAEELPGG